MQQFNNQGRDGIDLNSEANGQVKITVLGEADTNKINKPSENIKNKEGLLDSNISVTTPTVENEGNVDTDSADELTKKDDLQIITEAQPPLIIVPQVPVFYWEQG